MGPRLTPRQKMLVAAALLVALPVVALSSRFGAAGVARAVLGALAAGGLGWWVLRARGLGGAKFALPPRLSVIARAGLSQRAGVALVEADGEAYLVVHGEGFAHVRRTRRRATPRPRLVTDEVATLPVRAGGAS